MADWLDELDAAAEKATPGPLTGMRIDGPERYLAMCSPERIRALIACVNILAESQDYIGDDWRFRRDIALVALDRL